MPGVEPARGQRRINMPSRLHEEIPGTILVGVSDPGVQIAFYPAAGHELRQRPDRDAGIIYALTEGGQAKPRVLNQCAIQRAEEWIAIVRIVLPGVLTIEHDAHHPARHSSSFPAPALRFAHPAHGQPRLERSLGQHRPVAVGSRTCGARVREISEWQPISQKLLRTQFCVTSDANDRHRFQQLHHPRQGAVTHGRERLRFTPVQMLGREIVIRMQKQQRTVIPDEEALEELLGLAEAALCPTPKARAA
ncbi:MAG: hypothetical protein KGJ17_08015 [Gammaproteobacteria bacterium]|nr:hypothetical protein [Gammaproteobacteria bacterium]